MAASRPIPTEQVREIATLARLELSPELAERLAAELGDVLAYAEKLNQLDTSDVPPTTHAVPLPSRLRPDEVEPCLPVEEGLANAPEPIGQGFGVPKVIE